MSDLGSIVTTLLEMLRLEPVVVLKEAVLLGGASIAFLGIAAMRLGLRRGSGFDPRIATVIVVILAAMTIVGVGIERLEVIFLTAYVPCAILIRAGEGLALGTLVRPLHLALVGIALVVVAIFWKDLSEIRLPAPLPPDAFPHSAVTLGIAALSSFRVTQLFAEDWRDPTFLLAIFCVFLSVQLYLPHDQTMAFLYRWSFPVMVAAGILGRIAIRRRR